MNAKLNMDLNGKPTPIMKKSSLSLISSSYTLRCDPKQAELQFIQYEELISNVEHFYLGTYIPKPFIKGIQPKYLESLDSSGIPVINTLSIQDLHINRDACRVISDEEYEAISEERKLKKRDVLLTLDGGTSIGKPAIFCFDEDFTVDSHVAIIRDSEIAPKALVYLLASPFAQLQFKQAESGASGQTAVTEEDIRRFIFPKIQLDLLNSLAKELDSIHIKTENARKKLEKREKSAWEKFNFAMLEYAQKKLSQ